MAHLLLTFVEGNPSDKLSVFFDPAFRNADIWFLHTPDSTSTARDLMEAVRSREPRRTMRLVPLTECWNSTAVESVIAQTHMEAGAHYGTAIAVNLSDAPGVAQIVAEHFYAKLGVERFLVDPQSDRIVWIRQTNEAGQTGKPAILPVADTLNVLEYLRAHGMRVRSCLRSAAKERSGVTRALLRAPPEVSSYLQTLATNSTMNSGGRYAIDDRRLVQSPVQAILAQLRAAGLAEVQGTLLVFASAAAKIYVAGGWLESSVGHCLEELQNHRLVQHFLINIQVEDDLGVSAEIDGAFLANNNLYVIECKAQRNTKSRTWLDTLYAIADTLSATGILAINSELADSSIRMANAKGIDLIGRRDLVDHDRLEARLHAIVDARR